MLQSFLQNYFLISNNNQPNNSMNWTVFLHCKNLLGLSRTKPEIHSQFTCIVLDAMSLPVFFSVTLFSLGIFALEILLDVRFMASVFGYFKCNAKKSGADNERKWIMFEAQHRCTPSCPVPSWKLNHRWGGGHCAALLCECECISRCTVTVYCCHAEADK